MQGIEKILQVLVSRLKEVTGALRQKQSLREANLQPVRPGLPQPEVMCIAFRVFLTHYLLVSYAVQ